MKYTSIKSVLFSLSTLVDEEVWNENYFLEWAVKGARKLELINTYMSKVCTIEVDQYTATLPSDCQQITMVAVYNNPAYLASEDTNRDIINEILNLVSTNSTYKYLTNTTLRERVLNTLQTGNLLPVYKATSPFIINNNCTQALESNCRYEFLENPDGTITTSFFSGTIVIAYKGFADKAGDCLIPDNETVKEAIEAYVLYRYFEKKTLSSIQEATYRINSEMKKSYEEKFARLAMKAKSLNLPDISTMENIANMQNRLKPQQHQFDKLFSSLGYKENISGGGVTANGLY